jgi:biopolymer transport protein ExbB/TolQ
MSQPYWNVVQLFYHLANAFFWPVAVALLLLLAYALFDLGVLATTGWRRRCARRTDVRDLARALQANTLDHATLSPTLAAFWRRVQTRIDEVGSEADLDIWLGEVLRREEIEVASQLDRGRALVRIGPMLGLCGTIIPLGPALQSLLGGDMAGMVGHLVVGFGAVVCGLVMSGIAYFSTLVRERWTRLDIKEMEDLCDLVIRQLERRREVQHAAVQ